MQFLPGETLGQLGQFLTLKDILSLATTNSNFRENFFKPSMNKQLAQQFGFPYGLTLIELKRYEEMSPGARANAAATIGNLRLLKKAIGAYELLSTEEKIMPLKHVKYGAWVILPSHVPFDLHIALYNALENGHKEIIKYLLEIIPVKTLNLNGPLWNAAEKGDEELIDILLKYPTTITYTPNNIMAFAASSGRENIVVKMAKLGANNFETVYNIANEKGHDKLAEKIKELNNSIINK